MPYNKRVNKKKRPNGWKRRLQVYGKAGSQLYKDVSLLKGLINTEFKFKDTYNTGGSLADSVTTTGTFYLLNGISESVDYNGRTGRTIRIKSIQLRAEGVKNSSASAVATDIRLVLFWDMQPNGSAPTIGSLLETGTQSSLYAFRNLNYRHRYVILSDKRVRMDSDDYNVKLMEYYAKCNQKVIYASPSNGIGDIATGSLYLLAISNEATNTPTMHFMSRIRYIDN